MNGKVTFFTRPISCDDMHDPLRPYHMVVFMWSSSCRLLRVGLLIITHDNNKTNLYVCVPDQANES